MIEIPPLHMLDRASEAQLIHRLWYASTSDASRFHHMNDANGEGHAPTHTTIWESTDFPDVAIALVSIDTRSRITGRFTYIDNVWKCDRDRYLTALTGSGDYKVVGRYLISSERGEEKWPLMFAEANRRFLSDIFDPDEALCRITFHD